MKLPTLDTRTIPTLNTRLVQVLEAKAGSTERERGTTWMKKRRAVLLRDKYACVDCGRISMANEVDHDTPLERGGSNDEANLLTRCVDCHAAKTAREASARAGGW